MPPTRAISPPGRANVALACLSLGILLQVSCANTAGGGKGNGSVEVTVTPSSANVVLGATQQFEASVTGSSDTAVIWEVSGVEGGSANTGTISAEGLYAAPAAMPAGGNVTVTAVSEANPRDSGSASVALKDATAISVTPNPANVPTNGAQVFTATTGSGSPSTTFNWSINGVAGGNAAVGTIVPTGATTAVYTAPSAPPSPATVTVTATSAADASKSGSASATITCSATNTISPSAASAGLGGVQIFTVSLCVPAGSSIAWDVNGLAGGNSSLGTIVASSANTANYTAPEDLPGTNPVTVHAEVSPQPTGGPQVASASVTVTSGVTVNVAPPSATIGEGQRVSFAANVAGTADVQVTWSIAGVVNGNTAVGRVCAAGSNPCVAPTGPSAGSVDYLAPASVPATNPVTLTATSHADASKSGSGTIVITGTSGQVTVTVTPPYAFVAPSSGGANTVQFFATVTASGNTGVNWTVESAVAGQGCAGLGCGSVDTNGVYSAPAAAPSPNAIELIAVSQADPTKSAVATIAITGGPAIEQMLPSSVMAGAVQGFPLKVNGVNFVAGGGSGASTILVNGAARSTTCSSAGSCAIALAPADAQSAGTLTIEVQNPGNPAALSNPVPFVILPFDVSVNTISLTAGQPAANGENIVVVEPTTAAASAPINVNFVGLLTGGDSCGAQGSPLTVERPASGTETVRLCVQGDGLDPTFTYAFTGPSGVPDGSDIGVTASGISGLFPGMIELDLEISSTTAPGVRSLFITTLNNDRAVATGMLEVK